MPPDFAEQVGDILALLDGSHTAAGFPVHAVPGEGTGLTPWIFGSSKGQSAAVAGARGLPFVASYHSTPGTALEAVDAYRSAFTPSPTLSAPYVVVSADVVVADDTATARHLAGPYGHWVHSIRALGGAVPYPDPDDCPPLTDEQRAVVSDRIATQFVGDADEVADKLTSTAAGHRSRRTGGHDSHVPSRRPAAVARTARQTLGAAGMTREGKHRKQIHLAAHFPGVNNTTVWSDPTAGSQIEFDSFVHLARTAERGQAGLLLSRRGPATA